MALPAIEPWMNRSVVLEIDGDCRLKTAHTPPEAATTTAFLDAAGARQIGGVRMEGDALVLDAVSGVTRYAVSVPASGAASPFRRLRRLGGV